MKAMTATPLQSLSDAWAYEQQWRVPVTPAPAPAPPAVRSSGARAPSGMVDIPGGKYRFAVQGIEIEGSGASINNNPEGVDFQYEWDPVPQRFHVQWMTVKPFYMDKHPVTQVEFATYLQGAAGKAALRESLADPYHYLWNWCGYFCPCSRCWQRTRLTVRLCTLQGLERHGSAQAAPGQRDQASDLHRVRRGSHVLHVAGQAPATRGGVAVLRPGAQLDAAVSVGLAGQRVADAKASGRGRDPRAAGGGQLQPGRRDS
jgi:hypothetical protein